MSSLEIGQKLGQYGILDRLGAGGMGEVFVAEDTSLGRLVALKVLPDDLSSAPDVQMRFEQEARTIAALNHPNIVTVFSVEAVDDRHFMTMELVNGRALTDRLGEPMSFVDFLWLALPLCEAIAAAHGAGITHRDLKPDNIMINNDGMVKVLDFGIAKIAPSADQAMTVMRTSASVQGEVIGTVTHMSPEQAQGQEVDNRSDVFSLGVVFYEMLTGERPFVGDNPAAMISSILRDEPTPLGQNRSDLPRGLERILSRCLNKEPRRRFQTVRDVANELDYLREEVANEKPGDADTATGVKRSLSAATAAGLLAAGAVLGALALQVLPLSDAAPEAMARAVRQVTSQPMEELFPSLSPDGQSLAYANRGRGVWDIYVLRVGGQRAINLTEEGSSDDTQPAYSPDGDSIAFRSEREGGGLFVMGATGESVRRLTTEGHNPAWSPDGASLAYASELVSTEPGARTPPSSLFVVDVATGESRRVERLPVDPELTLDAVQPSWSPDGRWIAYWGVLPASGQRDIWMIRAEGGTPVRITESAALDWNPVFAPDGRLYFLSDRGGTMNVWRVEVDLDGGVVTGPPEAATVPSPSAAHLTFSAGGAMAYVSLQRTQNVHRFDFSADSPTGGTTSQQVSSSTVPITSPDVSDDGEWLTMQSWGSQEDLFIMRVDGTGFNQLTDDLHKDRRPRWSPTGDRIAYYSNRSGKHEVWVTNVDASGARQLTFSPEGASGNFPAWSPAGDKLVYYSRHEDANFLIDANLTTLEQTRQQLPDWSLGDAHFAVWSWSPDGRWLAGSLRAAEGAQLGGIVVHELATGEYRQLTDYGDYPEWLPDSSGVVVQSVRPADRLFVVDIADGAVRPLLDADVAEFAAHTYGRSGEILYVAMQSMESDVWISTESDPAGAAR